MEIAKPTKWLRRLLSKSKSKSSSPSLPPAPPPTVLTVAPTDNTKEEEEELIQEVFGRFDSDGDGKISTEELIAHLASIGEKISREEAQRVIKEFDENGDNLLEFKDFVKLIDEGDNNEGGYDDIIKSAFEMYEVDKGCGCITPVGLQRMLSRLGDVKSYEDCAAMIRAFDLDGNGVLDFHEFQQMMKGKP